MRPIFIALSPNVEKEDLLLAWRLLFSPQNWQSGRAVNQLETAFKEYFQTKYAVSFASGRTALWAVLKALDLKKNDEVLLQAYTCVAVPNAVLALGAKPVWVDIHPETFNLDDRDLKKKISSRTKAVIVQHTFGQAAAVEKIIDLAKRRQLLVIEDCAQSLGAKYRGQKLGTLADAAIFSFGRDKIISSVFGGLAIANQKRIGERLKKIQASLPLPSKFWIFQQLIHPLAFSLIINTYSLLGLGKGIHFLLRSTGFLSRAVYRQEKKGQMETGLMKKMPHALAVLAMKQFRKLVKFNRHRRKIARFYQRELQGLPFELPLFSRDHVFLRYTIKTAKAVELIEFAKKRGVFLGDWYRPVIAPRGVEMSQVFYQPGTCPKAEETSAQSVNLPTHPSMTFQDARKVVKVIKYFCES